MNAFLLHKNEHYLKGTCMLNLTTLFILMTIPALCVLSASFIVSFLENKFNHSL